MSLDWFPETDETGRESGFQSDLAGPGFLEAVKKQLGLRLDSQKGLSEALVVDHIERPSKN
jgi:uncharacterized protein (TIGR03435 family)